MYHKEYGQTGKVCSMQETQDFQNLELGRTILTECKQTVRVTLEQIVKA